MNAHPPAGPLRFGVCFFICIIGFAAPGLWVMYKTGWATLATRKTADGTRMDDIEPQVSKRLVLGAKQIRQALDEYREQECDGLLLKMTDVRRLAAASILLTHSRLGH